MTPLPLCKATRHEDGHGGPGISSPGVVHGRAPEPREPVVDQTCGVRSASPKTKGAEKGLESPRTPGIMRRTAPVAQREFHVPAGAPDWVTEELLQEAIDVWQPYYKHELSMEDALEITLSVGRLAEAISGEKRP